MDWDTRPDDWAITISRMTRYVDGVRSKYVVIEIEACDEDGDEIEIEEEFATFAEALAYIQQAGA